MFLITALSNGNWLNLRRVRAYPRIFLIVAALVGIGWTIGLHEIIKPDEGVVVTDFVNVYAAGLVVHQGRPSDAYNWPTQKIREDYISRTLNAGKQVKQTDESLPWLYPPMFLVVGWLAAFLPYFAALGAYSVVGLAAFAATLRKLVPPFKESYWALAAFPGVFINLFSGQNGFITTSLLAAGLYLLEASPIMAGMAFGVLSYKPHFFALIPLVLFVGRYWKALASTIISACVCALLSLAAFGTESWMAFVQGLALTRSIILENNADRWLGIVHSTFSAARALGGGVQTAYVLQTIVSVCAVIVLLVIWFRKSSPAVRGASLAAAALLVSPYSFVYDQVLLAIPIALLAKQGLQSGFLPFEKTFLFALWMLPFLVQDSGAHFAMPLTPPMLMCLMVMCWRRSKGEDRVFLRRLTF